MSRPTSRPSDSEWANAFQQAIQRDFRKPAGDGWKTLLELREEHGVSDGVMYKMIRSMIKAGEVERFVGTDRPPEWSQTNRQTWYRIVPKKK